MGAISDTERLREAVAAVHRQAEVFKETVAAASSHKARLDAASQKAEASLRALEGARKDAAEATEKLRAVHSQWGVLRAEVEKQTEATVRDATKRLSEAEFRIKSIETQSRKDVEGLLASARGEIGAVRDLIDTLEKDFRERLHAATEAEALASRSAIEEAASGARAASSQGLQEVERARKNAEDSIAEGRKESARRLDAMEDFVRGRLADYQAAFQPLRESHEALRAELEGFARRLQESENQATRVAESVEALRGALNSKFEEAMAAQAQGMNAIGGQLAQVKSHARRLVAAMILVGLIALAALILR